MTNGYKDVLGNFHPIENRPTLPKLQASKPSPDVEEVHKNRFHKVLFHKSKAVIKKGKEKHAERKRAKEEMIARNQNNLQAIWDNEELDTRIRFVRAQRYAIEHKKELTQHQITANNQFLQNLDLTHGITSHYNKPYHTPTDNAHNLQQEAKENRSGEAPHIDFNHPVTHGQRVIGHDPQTNEDILENDERVSKNTKHEGGVSDTFNAEVASIIAKENK